jgi:hypothetical protein
MAVYAPNKPEGNGMKRRILLSVIVIAFLFTNVFALLACNKREKEFRLIVPARWELEVGDSRSVDYAFAPTVTNRKLEWSVFPKNAASVDKWGRVTALKAGVAWIKATNPDGLKDSVRLRIVTKSKAKNIDLTKIDYKGKAVKLNGALQKIVSFYSIDSPDIPQYVSNITDFSQYQTVTASDGAQWSITEYGVLRVDLQATNERDINQRFMGDRYFYAKDKAPLAIVSDGGRGIWTIMDEGITHIELVELDGIDKAILMSNDTWENVARHGMVSGGIWDGTKWKGKETDNDGLWTSMYAAGELMRYSSLKQAGASQAQINAARQSAMISTEAVLLLSNICMRQGTTEAYVRYQPNAMFDPANGRYLSEVALKKGGDYSLNIPNISPAAAFDYAYEKFVSKGEKAYFLVEDYLEPFAAQDWADPREGGEYETRTRNLEGYVARTYSFREENNDTNGYIYWAFNGDGTASGTSTLTPTNSGYYLNGENLREVVVDASGEIPARLWNDMIGEGYSVEDIIYKGDTSSDEIIGHLFLYKLAYDILGSEDAELKQIISNTVDRLAQHVTDNGYMMVDGSGQPGTWSKYNRAFFLNSSQLGGAPLTASVILSLLKLAHYVTGYQKWHNEYLMAALDPSYEYAKIMAQYAKQVHMVMLMTLDDNTSPQVRKMIDSVADLSFGSPTSEMLARIFLNYSDEEMAMLAFYLLFQMESDAKLLGYYRDAIDQWWISIKYSENPLWYYIYQLAYPDREIKDAYGNNILETAAWSLSRHPIDMRKLSASNTARDDIGQLNLSALTGGGGYTLSYLMDENAFDVPAGVEGLIKLLRSGKDLTWAVAAPDERPVHKYNNNFYDLKGNYNPNAMEGSTTYTLPFWMGIYHNMLTI